MELIWKKRWSGCYYAKCNGKEIFRVFRIDNSPSTEKHKWEISDVTKSISKAPTWFCNSLREAKTTGIELIRRKLVII